MLRNLEVTNFKAWHKLRMALGRVTGVFGANSSGKSSVLQFLLLLKQTKNATDRGIVVDFGGPNELVNLGKYQDLVHRGNDKVDIEWTLDWDLPSHLKINDPMGQRQAVLMEGDSLQVNSRVGWKGPGTAARHLRYKFSDTVFAIEPKPENPSEFNLRSEGPHSLQLIRNQGRGWALPGPIKTHLFPDQARTYFQNTSFLSHFEAEYEALMDRIYYLGPLREHPTAGRGQAPPMSERAVSAASMPFWPLPHAARRETSQPESGTRASRK